MLLPHKKSSWPKNSLAGIHNVSFLEEEQVREDYSELTCGRLFANTASIIPLSISMIFQCHFGSFTIKRTGLVIIIIFGVK